MFGLANGICTIVMLAVLDIKVSVNLVSVIVESPLHFVYIGATGLVSRLYSEIKHYRISDVPFADNGVDNC